MPTNCSTLSPSDAELTFGWEIISHKRFKLTKFWINTTSSKTKFLKEHSHSIRAIVGNFSYGVDAEMIKIDLVKCKEQGIRVTNTTDVLTDDVADLAIGLLLATLHAREGDLGAILGGGFYQHQAESTPVVTPKKKKKILQPNHAQKVFDGMTLRNMVSILATSLSLAVLLYQPLGSSQLKCVFGGLLLAADYLLVSIWYIL